MLGTLKCKNIEGVNYGTSKVTNDGRNDGISAGNIKDASE